MTQFAKNAHKKFFNDGNGYGFFTIMDGSEEIDVFFHHSRLKEYSLGNCSTEKICTADITYEIKADGRYVCTEVHATYEEDGTKIVTTDLEIGEKAIARVQFFDSNKGFGFLTVVSPKDCNDVYIQKSDIPAEMLDVVIKNQLLDVEVIAGGPDLPRQRVRVDGHVNA